MGVVALLMIQGPDPAGGLPAMAFVIIQTAAAVLISIIKGASTLTGRGHATLVLTLQTAKSKCGHRIYYF